MQKNKIILGVIIAILVIAVLGFVAFRANERSVSNIIVNILDKQRYEFVTEKDILETIAKSGLCQIGITKLSELDLRMIEEKVKTANFIAVCHASKDLMGNLVIDVKQNRPLARVFRPNMQSDYVAENGAMMQLSKKYTARVPIVVGEGTYKLKNSFCQNDTIGKQLLNFLTFIDQDEFWKAQIVQIEFDNKNQLAFYTQAGNQRIELGKPENYERKLAKLMTFYKEIVPVKGWTTYRRVNLAYEKQIICE
jgi:cell division protein FtsQ